MRLANGSAQPLATDVRLGRPAGLTLTADGSTLLVSSLNATTGTAQVLALDPVSGRRAGVVDEVIGANRGAGGPHRAHRDDSAAWADVSHSGRVYRVETNSLSLHRRRVSAPRAARRPGVPGEAPLTPALHPGERAGSG